MYANEFLQVFPNSIIWCYEPNPSEFGRLSQLASKYSSVTAVNKGLSDSERADYIHINMGTASSSLLPLDVQAAKIWGTDALTPNSSLQIQLTTGDSEFDRLNISRIDILKIDAQGHEINVLQGLRDALANRLIANIYLEVLVAPSYQGQPSAGELLSFVESSGFRLVGIFNEYFSLDGLLLQFDALFTLQSLDRH